MSKFSIIKEVDLGFLGKAWEENKCNLQFSAFTIRDIKERFPKISADNKNSEAMQNGLDQTIDLLKEHFVKGTGIDDKGEVVEIKGEELIDLPAEVITKIFSFLSEPLVKAENPQ